MEQRFEVRSAFVMGGTTGIGRAAGEMLARQGAKVTLFGLPASADDAAVDFDDLPEGCEATFGDGANAEDVRSAVAAHVARTGGVDILVCAAAIHPYGDATETGPADFARVMAVNVGSVHTSAHYCIPEMRKRGGGAIVTVSSNQGSAANPGVAAYVASKGAILSLTRSLAVDFGKDGIRANSVSPGPIDTPLLRIAAERFGSGSIDETYADWGRKLPLGRIGSAEDIARVVTFLASEDARNVTGADLVADGGLLSSLGF